MRVLGQAQHCHGLSFKRADGSALTPVTQVQEVYCRQTCADGYTTVPALR